MSSFKFLYTDTRVDVCCLFALGGMISLHVGEVWVSILLMRMIFNFMVKVLIKYMVDECYWWGERVGCCSGDLITINWLLLFHFWSCLI